ncbi:efflux transporter, RND family, MFP subunit [compost metagenome]
MLVLDDKNHATYRQVKLGANQDGLRVIDSGLAAGERIVVNGLQRIRPGDAVTPTVVPMIAAQRKPVATASAAQN